MEQTTSTQNQPQSSEPPNPFVFARPAFIGEGQYSSSFRNVDQQGITLRDLYAGMALIGLLSDRRDGNWSNGGMSAQAWQLADEMLKRRGEGRSK